MVEHESTSAGPQALHEASARAMARVLDAERAAGECIEQARLEVERLAEASRIAARAIGERTERRIRAVTRAFESDTAERVARIDNQDPMAGQPDAASHDDDVALRAAVEALARELIGGQR